MKVFIITMFLRWGCWRKDGGLVGWIAWLVGLGWLGVTRMHLHVLFLQLGLVGYLLGKRGNNHQYPTKCCICWLPNHPTSLVIVGPQEVMSATSKVQHAQHTLP